MTVMVVTEITGVTAEQDAAMMKTLGVESSPPEGIWLRMAGPMASGWRIVSLWDSEADFERFREERLMPATADAGLEVPKAEIWPIEKFHAFRANNAS